MRFTETSIEGAFVVDIEPREDERGFFARAYCTRELEAQGLHPTMVQANLSGNRARGTVRGLHYQDEPVVERKLFRCIQGATFHAVADMRPNSATYLGWVGVELSAESKRALYVPALCATGYQALADGAEALYFVSEFYSPEHERGVRYDDPAIGIEWPLPVSAVSEKDLAWPTIGAPAARARG
jgi:dTDP-4-dehydrorhamnose 3,5-epimerase